MILSAIDMISKPAVPYQVKIIIFKNFYKGVI